MSHSTNGHASDSEKRPYRHAVSNTDNQKLKSARSNNAGDTVDHQHTVQSHDSLHNGLNGRCTAEYEDDDMFCRPRHVGILDMELYLPPFYVDQDELEQHDNCLKGENEKRTGRYTEGLGQWRMGVCTDREDIVSISKTVVARLLQRSGGIGYDRIGRLEVGTETLVDKSKSVKSCLMDLFEASGNFNVDGTDCLNACYGGTQALFNAVNWIESSAWDGRYAVVVAADIAIYGEGSARCTGGAGAVALLIGPDAPVVIDQHFKSTCAQHVWDFYKPNLASEYPLVDGPASVVCYLSALDSCYKQFCSLVEQKETRWLGSASSTNTRASSKHHHLSLPVTLESFDHIVFHAPYCKLVQKSVARLKYLDYHFKNRHGKNGFVTKHSHFAEHADDNEKHAHMKSLLDLPLAETYTNRTVGKLFEALSADDYAAKTKPSLLLARAVGNMYTASVFACLISLISSIPALNGDGSAENSEKRTVVFSYGSGMIASMYLIRLRTSHPKYAALYRKFSQEQLQQHLDCMQRVSPLEFTRMLTEREALLTLPKVVLPKKPHHTAPADAPNCDVMKKLADMRSFSLSSPPAEQEAKQIVTENTPVSATKLVLPEPSHGGYVGTTPSPTPLLLGENSRAVSPSLDNKVDPVACGTDAANNTGRHFFVPKSSIDVLEAGSFYLDHIDAHMRRHYAAKTE